MTIALSPVPPTPGWALVGLVVAVCVGTAVGLGAYRRNRRIMRRGARLPAQIVAAEAEQTPGPYSARLRNVRLRLRFEGIEDHELDFLGYRLRADDAAALTPGATVQVWVLPEDLSEVRIARPDGVERILPFQSAPEVAGEYPTGGIDGLGTLLDRPS
ncbi:hypothetical protein [Dactylosporangium sp. CA-139066]|uniref:hypothetical protein n=1 Tax=Dactylosporangium sp. CA-139066 TaxID=3239930 RepID=UPI003D8FF64C